jgi:putative intracellular protease/amidase
MMPEFQLKKRILFVLSEWGFWGEELIGPYEVLSDPKAGYAIEFVTPNGKRPVALPPSTNPGYEDPPLGKSVTSPEMAKKVEEINKSSTLSNPRSLAAWFPERPYWSEKETLTYKNAKGVPEEISSPLRKWEAYYRLREQAQNEATACYDAIVLVGGSGPMIDMVNNYRVHDLILGFKERNMPVAAECYGVACLAQARNFDDAKSIIWGKHVTGHAKEYDYKDLTGVLDPETGQVLTRQSGNWVNLGPPFYTLEYILRDATGPDGGFHGNVGRATSVIVDYPFITGRSTPDSYLTGEMLRNVLEHGLTRYGW